MFQRFVLGAAVLVGSLVFAGAVQSESKTLKGRCSVAAAVHGGKKFVVVKCDRANNPGEFVIRSEIWEKDDSKAYRNLARFSGRRFTCDLTIKGRNQSGWTQSTYYKTTNCR